MAPRVLLPAGFAVAALGRFAWQIVFTMTGDSFAGSVRGTGAALGLALVAWAARSPEERTGPLAAGAALVVAMDAWILAANLAFADRWMIPFSITMLGLLALAWVAFTTARGAWSRAKARSAAVGAGLALAGALAWVPLNLAPGGLAWLPGTALAVVGFACALLALLAESGVAMPRIALRWPRRAQS